MQCALAGLCAKDLVSTWRTSSDLNKSILSAHFDHSENKLTTEESSVKTLFSWLIKVIVFVNCYCCELWIECDGRTRPGEWSALQCNSSRGCCEGGEWPLWPLSPITRPSTQSALYPLPQYNAQNMAGASPWYNRIRLKLVHCPRSFFFQSLYFINFSIVVNLIM